MEKWPASSCRSFFCLSTAGTGLVNWDVVSEGAREGGEGSNSPGSPTVESFEEEPLAAALVVDRLDILEEGGVRTEGGRGGYLFLYSLVAS